MSAAGHRPSAGGRGTPTCTSAVERYGSWSSSFVIDHQFRLLNGPFAQIVVHHILAAFQSSFERHIQHTPQWLIWFWSKPGALAVEYLADQTESVVVMLCRLESSAACHDRP
jgi:hypothetical protein